MSLHEASFWEPSGEDKVHCHLCRFHCVIAAGRRGLCGVRENRDGTLYTLVYGQSVAESIDPIEKKPLFHFHPGSRSLSMATVGCNFRCLHCQNADIAQWPRQQPDIPGREVTPEALVDRAVASRCASISYTYTEPTIFYEYAYDTAVAAHAAGVKNVFVTNGYITSEALEKIAPYLDAANVDLKGFSDDLYRQVTGASLDGVLACLKDYHRLGIWIEVTTLVIPEHNDSPDELRQVAEFIAGELSVEVPWHVSAFHPTYKMQDRPPTPAATLMEASRIGREAGLHYVYLGNVRQRGGEDTLCPACGAAVVRRTGLQLAENRIVAGACPDCRQRIPGVGMDSQRPGE